MSDKPWNPLRLDVAAFARGGAELAGEWAAAELSRLADSAAPEAPVAGWAPVRWRLRGEERARHGAAPEVWLQLQVEAEAWPVCQRCLKPVRLPLQVDRAFRFVRSEDEAAALDAELDDDVLVLSPRFDVREWVEDELLLALPIVPLHEQCPEPLPLPANDAHADAPADTGIEASVTERPNPFAVLQQLKPRKS